MQDITVADGSRRSLSRSAKVLGRACIVWFVCSGCFLGLPLLTGTQFLPSASWVLLTDGFEVWGGVFNVVFWLAAAIANSPIDFIKRNLLKLLGAMILVFGLGYVTIVPLPPAILAVVTGSQIDLPYTVSEADRAYRRRCGYAASVEGIPFPSGRICGLPKDFQATLSPGMQVLVRGRGTSYGVFVDSVAVAE